jgi:1-acyl-sn-glycerol-3-phosphate acyltransferase
LKQAHTIVIFYRIGRILLHTLLGLVIAAFVWSLVNKKRKLTLIKWWCGRLINHFNIQIITRGIPPSQETRGAMFVANHVSWADIHTFNSIIPLRFIAKIEINNWPIFGYLVKKSGTIFIDRTTRKDASRIVEIATKALLNNDNVGFFPEGTTTDGTYLLPFKASILQAAISANATIWPVAIRYANSDGSTNIAMAYAGETTLGESMMRVLKQKNPAVEITFLRPIETRGLTRQVLSQATYSAISQQLNF